MRPSEISKKLEGKIDFDINHAKIEENGDEKYMHIPLRNSLDLVHLGLISNSDEVAEIVLCAARDIAVALMPSHGVEHFHNDVDYVAGESAVVTTGPHGDGYDSQKIPFIISAAKLSVRQRKQS